MSQQFSILLFIRSETFIISIFFFSSHTIRNTCQIGDDTIARTIGKQSSANFIPTFTGRVICINFGYMRRRRFFNIIHDSIKIKCNIRFSHYFIYQYHIEQNRISFFISIFSPSNSIGSRKKEESSSSV